mgnify:CR=1 FL=1
MSVLAAADALSLARTLMVELAALRGVALAVEAGLQRGSVTYVSALPWIAVLVAVVVPRRGGLMMTGHGAAGGPWGRGRTPGVVAHLTSASVEAAAVAGHGDSKNRC